MDHTGALIALFFGCCVKAEQDLTAQIDAAVASYSSNQGIWKHTFRGTRLLNLLEQPSRENSLQPGA